jgi:hypothetical protein
MRLLRAASPLSTENGHAGRVIVSIHARTSTNVASIAWTSATLSVHSSDAAIMMRA